MVCPICELKVDEAEHDAENTNSFVCRRCNALIIIKELPADEFNDKT